MSPSLGFPIRLYVHMGPSVLDCRMTWAVALELELVALPKGSKRTLANGLSFVGKILGFAAQSLSPNMDICPPPVRVDLLALSPALG